MARFRSWLASALLKAYKYTLSPVFMFFGASCRHHPTCSEYAADCMKKHGIWPAFWMAMARIARCRPGGSKGLDPAPEQKPNAPLWAPWRYGDWTGPKSTD
ncbi:MAG: membrane protein insertion efficiency factor YidD [Pseudomonadota bacterium]